MADSKDRSLTIQAQPTVTHDAPVVSGEVRVGQGSDIRYLTEQEEARERLKASVDRLTEQASLRVQVEKEPLKMLGGASAVGAVLGLLVGRQFRRSKKIYVDAHSPVKHQKAFVKAQQKQKGSKNDLGGALVATLGTMAVKMLTDKVLAPKLESVANGLLDKAGQPKGATKSTPAARASSVAAASTASTVPAQDRPTAALAQDAAATAAQTQSAAAGVHYTANPVHPGVVPIPDSKVEAKAQGTPISEDQKANPNL
ncbi:MAG: hypothetical protein Q4C89_07330 [Deinococcus sp.]|uniref:hypothetical protein n=1 Tax=Deinococcus sp. TaxID=47478 RepID=UPI0026DD1EA2|nr:hypothetical protein [Deinococcus sp.]MDO4245816.1 hypothetical protein [Deinococcus sp.]